MCLLRDIMRKDEEYARGMVRLHPNDPESTETAQYALDLQKLRLAHERRCSQCEHEATWGEGTQ